MVPLKKSVVFIIILLSLIIGSSILRRGHEWGDDFASYIMQGQSILNGTMDEFVQRNAFTIYESSFQIGPVAYPWGYPLFLTPALLLKGVHPLALKLPGLFFFAGFLFCFYLIIKDRFTQFDGWLLISLFAFNPRLIVFLDQILSDIPFLFVVTLGLLLIAKMDRNKRSWIYYSWIGVFIFTAFFVRTTGIILLGSYIICQVIWFYREPVWRKNIMIDSIVSILVFVALWVVSSWIFPNGQGSYFEQLKRLNQKIFIENISIYFHLFSTFFGSGTGWTYVYYMLVLFFLIGAWKGSSSDLHLIIFFVFYLLAILLWPERQGLRFIFPLLPIFVFFVYLGMVELIRLLLPGRYGAILQGGMRIFWLTLIGLSLFNSGSFAYSTLNENRKINGPFDPFTMDVYNYIKSETTPESVIIFHKPRAMRLMTNHDALLITECDNLKLGDYVVLSKKVENGQIPLDEIFSCNLPLAEEFENRRFVIYRIEK